MDPESSLQVTGLIRSLAVERGTTIFLCTHNLPLAERICDSYGFLHEGELVAMGTQEELAREVADAKKLVVTTLGGSHEHVFRREEEINGIIRGVMDAGEHILEVRVLRPDLEAIYFHYIRRRSGERAEN